MSVHRYRSLVGAAAVIAATGAFTMLGGAGVAIATGAPTPEKCVEYPVRGERGIKCVWKVQADCEVWRHGLLEQGWRETFAQCQRVEANAEIKQWSHPAGFLGGANPA